MSDLSTDFCSQCGIPVNCWGDKAFYETGLCEDCRKKQSKSRQKTSLPPSKDKPSDRYRDKE